MTTIRTTNLDNARRAVVNAAEAVIDAPGIRARMKASKRLLLTVRAYQYLRDNTPPEPLRSGR